LLFLEFHRSTISLEQIYHQSFILSNNEIIAHRLLLLFHMLAWNHLISLLALISQRAMNGQVLSLTHKSYLDDRISYAELGYIIYIILFENQGRCHSIEKVYITSEMAKIHMNKQLQLLGKH